MRINLKMAVIGALGAASVLALASEAQAAWRYGYRGGLGYGHARGYGLGGYRYGLGGRYGYGAGRFGYGRYGYGLGRYGYGYGRYGYGYGRRWPYVVGGIYAGAAIGAGDACLRDRADCSRIVRRIAARQRGADHQLDLVEEHQRQDDHADLSQREQYAGHRHTASEALLRAAKDDDDLVRPREAEAAGDEDGRQQD